LPESSERQKERRKRASSDYGIARGGQEDAEKEKISDAPDPPPYNHAAFIRHVQTLTMKKQDEMLDKLMGFGEDF